MSNDVQTTTDQRAPLTELVKGIVGDIGDLIRQEVRFARTEIKSDLQKTQTAVVLLSLGSAVAGLGTLLLSLMFVHLLHRMTIPTELAAASVDPARLPLWGCYGLVSLLFLVIGGSLVMLGVNKFKSFNPLPDETAKSVQENVSWITNSK